MPKNLSAAATAICNLKHLAAVCRVIRSSNNWYQAISDINCIISWPMPYGDSSIFVNYTWFFFFFHQKKKKRGIKFWEVLLDGICLCHFRLRIFPNLARRTLCNFFLQTFLLCFSFISSCDYTTSPSPKLTLILKNYFTCWIARK